MSVSAPCPPDHPLMIAWNAYKATEEYPNTKKWAVYPEHVEGSLWAAFMAGFNAQSVAISDDMPKWREALVKISILDHERPLAAYLAVNVACTALGIEPLDGSSSWVKCDKCYRVAQSRDLEGQRCGDTLTHNDPGCGGTMRPHREATK